MTTSQTLYRDHYAGLGGSMRERLQHLYWALRQQYSGMDRFSVALYQPLTNSLNTFACEGDAGDALVGYSVVLDDVPSLADVIDNGNIRVINDMRIFRCEDPSSHTAMLLGHGFRSSFTMPLVDDGQLIGAMFLNSHQLDYFDDAMVVYCSLWGHLVEQTIAREQATLRRLRALVSWSLDVTNARSDESEEHMRRMGLMSRMVAAELQAKHKLSDSWVEYIGMFAPMHDLGKIAVPDSILNKPGALTSAEFQQIQRHTIAGRALVEKAIRRFDLEHLEHVDMLGIIVLHHHEKMDGSGYQGLKGEDIPLEARIVAVCDIADALLNRRCYKQPWSEEAVWEELMALGKRGQLDEDCVMALVGLRQDVMAIQQSFRAAA